MRPRFTSVVLYATTESSGPGQDAPSRQNGQRNKYCSPHELKVENHLVRFTLGFRMSIIPKAF